MGFLEYITEARSAAVNPPNLEDRVLHGRDGAEHALNGVRSVSDALAGSPGAKITVNLHGVPIKFGNDEHGFFIEHDGKISHTPEEIEDHHTRDVHDELKTALEHLPKITPQRGVYGGDVMYTQDGVHEDPKNYNFTPATLMYSVKKDSPEGKKVKNARVGVVVHSQYHFGSDRPAPTIQLSQFKNHRDVHLIDPEVQMTKVGKGTSAVSQAEQAYLATPPDAWDVSAGHRAHMQKYLEKTSKEGVKPTAPGFKQFLKTKFQDAAKGHSTRTALNKMRSLIDHHAHIDDHHDSYEGLFSLYHSIQDAKNSLMEPLAKNNPFEITRKGQPVPAEYVVHLNDTPSLITDRRKPEKDVVNEEVLLEGGNVKIGEHSAEPIPVDKEHVHDIHKAMQAIHDSYHKAHHGHVFGEGGHALKTHSAYSGSTRTMMTHPEAYAKHKPKAGDVDLMVNKDTHEHLANHLEAHPKQGPYTVVGVRRKGQLRNVLMKHNKTGAVHQFDFESVQYHNHEPTKGDQFGHSGGHLDDMALGIKGQHHKLLIHTVASMQGKKFAITRGIKPKEAPPHVEGIRDPEHISHDLFKHKDQRIHSFTGVAHMIKEHIPKEQHQAITDHFVMMLNNKQHVDHGPAIKHLKHVLNTK